MLVGNYEYAGTNKFTTHLLSADEQTTLCGIRIWDRRGDWQETGENDRAVSCLRCKKAAQQQRPVDAVIQGRKDGN